MSIFQITPTIQNYDWGKTGISSKVAQLASASNIPGFSLADGKPYAELWMGTHVSGPSRISSTGELLSDHLKANPDLIGSAVLEKFKENQTGDLPFLFKVLSIEKALSIQTHPDKETARRLHAEKPEIYKDANHKPEMAIALTPFTGLCGFLPISKLATYLQSTPEFAALIPDKLRQEFLIKASSNSTAEAIKPSLKKMFSALMNAKEVTFVPELERLISRYRAGDVEEAEKPLVDLVLRLNDQFPNDIGIFCTFVLNYLHLDPGSAMFLGAGEPHAYLSGDMMECMATSDNVIRAGLTPKLRDIPNLVSGLTYQPSEPEKHLLKPREFSSKTRLFNPPVPEFSVLQVDLKEQSEEIHRVIHGPSIAIVTQGSGSIKWKKGEEELHEGKVMFIGAETEVTFKRNKGLQLYRAFVE